MMVFRLFSLLFSYPSPEVVKLIEQLSNNKIFAKVESVSVFNSADLADLQVEYTRLFVNSYPTLLCPPYESFHREGALYGNAVTEVLQLYHQYQLEYVYDGEPPDHISVELDFFAETSDQEFLDRMRQWIPQFTAGVKKNSTIYGVFAGDLEDLLCAYPHKAMYGSMGT
jgi:nitrate reductase assembly molybdenum cofactor insertion protein NarJ